MLRLIIQTISCTFSRFFWKSVNCTTRLVLHLLVHVHCGSVTILYIWLYRENMFPTADNRFHSSRSYSSNLLHTTYCKLQNKSGTYHGTTPNSTCVVLKGSAPILYISWEPVSCSWLVQLKGLFQKFTLHHIL